MDPTIIIALISGGCSLIGTFAGVVVSNNLTQYRLEQLEKKVEKHNGLVEKTYGLQQEMVLVEEKIKVANHRIDDLEKGQAHD